MIRLKNRRLIVVLAACLVAVAGTYLLVSSQAATIKFTAEPESGSLSKGALKVADSVASGSAAIRFQPTQYKGSVVRDGNDFVLNKGSYGSMTTLRSKGYTKLDIGQVADAAATAVTSCSLGNADTKLDWRNVTCQPFEDTGWRQQGITGVGGSGWSNRDDIIVTSWHDGAGEEARLTVMNTTTKKRTFVMLVRPCTGSSGYCDMASPSDQCNSVHAGGVAWYKNVLYVADTNCLMVYDMNEFYRLSNGSYILPATTYWKRQDTSYGLAGISIDTSTGSPQLLSVNYLTDCSSTPFYNWNLQSSDGMIAPDAPNGSVATAADKYHVSGICNAQGIARTGGDYIINTSGGGTDYMYRYKMDATGPADSKFLMPYNTPQNLYIDPVSGQTWSLTESPNGDSDKSTRIFSWTTAKMLQ